MAPWAGANGNRTKERLWMIGQIVSKKRVADHGEVFTSQREVNAMLDLVKPQTQRIDASFLEPPLQPT